MAVGCAVGVGVGVLVAVGVTVATCVCVAVGTGVWVDVGAAAVVGAGVAAGTHAASTRASTRNRDPICRVFKSRLRPAARLTTAPRPRRPGEPVTTRDVSPVYVAPFSPTTRDPSIPRLATGCTAVSHRLPVEIETERPARHKEHVTHGAIAGRAGARRSQEAHYDATRRLQEISYSSTWHPNPGTSRAYNHPSSR